LKIRSKIIIGYAEITLVTALFILCIVYFTLLNNFEKFAGTALKNQVGQAAKAIDNFMFTRVKDLNTFSNNPIFSIGTHEDVSDYLTEIVKAYPYYDTFYYVDTKAVILASSDRTKVGKNLLEFQEDIKEELQKTITGGAQDVYVSDLADISPLQEGKDIELDIEMLSDVVNKDGSKLGALIGLINTEFIKNFVFDIDERTIGAEYAYLVDDPGNVVITADPHLKILEPHHDLGIKNLKQKLEGDEDGYVVYINHHGDKVITGYTDLGEYGEERVGDWSLLSTAPYKDIMAPVYQIMYTLLLIFIIVLVCGAVFFVVLSNIITKPILKLKEAAVKISKGNLDTKLKIDSSDEIGSLAGSFNKMTEDLKKRNEEITATNQKLRASNQQLENNERQFKESNQQLKVNEQQLKTSNQQLATANEKIEKSKRELEEKLSELERFQNITGRPVH